uniref:PGG domain-containing protein n=1 Tax=Davidia involucrata TaxID=16924 RepID=A0A5B7ALN6_DAVIN
MRHNKELYAALMSGDERKVIELCRQIPEGPLHILTIHNDTVLHMATYSKQKELVLNLLKEVPENQSDKLTHQNEIGNTILQEAATSNRIVPAAEEMLRRAPELLSMRNRNGETALFRAARFGKNDMFRFLDDQVNKILGSDHGREADRKAFYHRNDNTTILHISILNEYFDLAILIATKYEYLVSERDGDNMTALQLLACNPSVFKCGSKHGFLKRRLINSCAPTEDTTVTAEDESCCRVPLWEAIQNQKQKCESALELAKFLIERDISWEATKTAIDQSKPKIHKYGGPCSASQGQGVDEIQTDPTSLEISSSTVKIAETPLFLATKSGCTEIVEEILKMYPQAVEHIDDEGCNILHVAIKYRQIQILDIVEKMEIPMIRLLRKIDDNGNSILHMVGIIADDRRVEDMRSPALLLQEDLLLFERVNKISTAHFIKHFNSEGQTAEKLFAENNAKLRADAKEWLKRTAENCSIIAVLIATVAFTAAYTIPGGPNEKTGYPILLSQSFFVVFTITDVLSLAFALTSVITFLSILTSPFQLKDFKRSLPQRLMLGVTLLILSVSMMMLAFAATIILMIHKKEQWTKVALYSVAFLPVTIFAFSYLPLYLLLMKTFEYSLKKIWEAFPRCSNIVPLHSWITNSFKCHESQATTK